MAPASPLPTLGWSRHRHQHPRKPISAPSRSCTISCLWLCTFACIPTCSLLVSLGFFLCVFCFVLFSQAESTPLSSSPQIPPPAISPVPHHRDPSRSAAAFAAVSLPCLKCRKEIHVQLTVSVPCNHFVSQKALLSNPHRQTGRGWIGERHLTPISAFFPPLFSFCILLYGWDECWVYLSLSGCFGDRPE